MYVITAEVKYSDDSDYIKSFLNYDQHSDSWNWYDEGAEFFSASEDAEFVELTVINGDNPLNEYYAGVKNIKIQEVKLFDFS